MSAPEEALALQLRAVGIEYTREYRFVAHATGGTGKGCRQRIRTAGLRDWRADFALLDHRILVECEGGAHVQGRHVRGAGFHADLLKYAAAARLGWHVLRFDPAMIKSGIALQTIEAVMEAKNI